MRLDNEGLLTEDPNRVIASYLYPSICVALNTVFSLRLISFNNHTCPPYVPLWLIIILCSHAFLGLAGF
ncbi:hypothetical protein F5882DRAFT_388306 [Hyaloscypha sp. PMI_1271]|nr:hypothetical protein F5882DRAFT_388306 [Hyaloscypha sp. PMI_1271]